jgi:hypothetical protein
LRERIIIAVHARPDKHARFERGAAKWLPSMPRRSASGELQADFLTSNAVVASFDALLPATVEKVVANVEISKEKETGQTRARSPRP